MIESIMKINIIIPGVGLTGGIRVVFKYSELLEKAGHNVVFYTPIKAYDVKNHKSELINFRHVITNSLKRFYLYKVRKIHKKIIYNVKVIPVLTINDSTIRDADITIATAWPTAFSVEKLNETKGKKVYFIQGYEIWNSEQLGKKSYTLDLHKITISKWIREKIESQLGEEKIPIVYDGLDLELYNSSKELKAHGDNFQFLMLYHNLAQKGVADGIQVFERIRKDYPKLRLRMFGMEKAPHIPEYVEYYYNPSKETLKELYNMSDIFIFPSHEEGWGLTPLEAMASRCAVVGYNVGCMLDIGKSGENVQLSEPGDLDLLEKNIRKLINDRDFAQELANKGYASVQKFSWDRCAIEFERALEEIVDEN